jgi:hypothetical protein
MPKFHKFIYHEIIRPSRLGQEAKIVNDLDGKTILDVGYFDGLFQKLLKNNLMYMGIDPNPNIMIKDMPLLKIEEFKPEKKFDIVVASNVLEHLEDPVVAIKKIKSLSKKYICIGVPYEPFYSITRFFIPEKEHLWTIHPDLLKFYFGKPIKEKYFHLKRSYFAVFLVN